MDDNTKELLIKRRVMIDQLNQAVKRSTDKKFYSIEGMREALQPIAQLAIDIIDVDSEIIDALEAQIPKQD